MNVHCEYSVWLVQCACILCSGAALTALNSVKVKSKDRTELFLELHLKPSFLFGRICEVCKNTDLGLIQVAATSVSGGISFSGVPPTLS
jgi:hypothetical protein